MWKSWNEQGNAGPVPEKPRSEANYKYKGKLNWYISIWSKQTKWFTKLLPASWAAVSLHAPEQWDEIHFAHEIGWEWICT